MPRIARIVAVDFPHHITQRGNYGQNVFRDDSDRKQYLDFIQDYSSKHNLLILAYCLMTNHVHFIVVPSVKDSMARTFRTAHMRYSQYFNKKKRSAGHLWQSRFYSYIMDEPHLMLAARYIERNPVRAGLIKRPWQWKWSSAAYHTEKDSKSIIRLGNLFKFMEMKRNRWKDYIEDLEEEDTIKNIDKHLISGRPFAEDNFIKRLEVKLDRKLTLPPRGRPRKERKKCN